MRKVAAPLLASLMLVGTAASVSAEPNALQTSVAAVKDSLKQSAASLKRYEWIETTIVKLKGKEKSRQQKRCYYGAEGKVQKVAIGEPAAEAKKPRGRRGRRRGKVAEKKKAELSGYMKRAVSTVKMYVPPEFHPGTKRVSSGRRQLVLLWLLCLLWPV